MAGDRHVEHKYNGDFKKSKFIPGTRQCFTLNCWYFFMRYDTLEAGKPLAGPTLINGI